MELRYLAKLRQEFRKSILFSDASYHWLYRHLAGHAICLHRDGPRTTKTYPVRKVTKDMFPAPTGKIVALIACFRKIALSPVRDLGHLAAGNIIHRS